jgi:hypothetical protein
MMKFDNIVSMTPTVCLRASITKVNDRHSVQVGNETLHLQRLYGVARSSAVRASTEV